MKKKFKHLIVIGHPDHKSFCYNGIYKTIVKNKIFAYYRGLQNQSEAKAQTYEGYADSIKNLKIRNNEIHISTLGYNLIRIFIK